jgi:hypothetical protein
MDFIEIIDKLVLHARTCHFFFQFNLLLLIFKEDRPFSYLVVSILLAYIFILSLIFLALDKLIISLLFILWIKYTLYIFLIIYQILIQLLFIFIVWNWIKFTSIKPFISKYLLLSLRFLWNIQSSNLLAI